MYLVLHIRFFIDKIAIFFKSSLIDLEDKIDEMVVWFKYSTITFYYSSITLFISFIRSWRAIKFVTTNRTSRRKSNWRYVRSQDSKNFVKLEVLRLLETRHHQVTRNRHSVFVLSCNWVIPVTLKVSHTLAGVGD